MSRSGFIRTANMRTSYHVIPLHYFVSVSAVHSRPATRHLLHCFNCAYARSSPRTQLGIHGIPMTTFGCSNGTEKPFSSIHSPAPRTGSVAALLFHPSTRPHHNSHFFQLPQACYAIVLNIRSFRHGLTFISSPLFHRCAYFIFDGNTSGCEEHHRR